LTDLARRVATGAGWLYSYRWLDRLLDFVAIVVLARILSPDDFGLVAIAASVVTIIEGLSAFDVNKALIRSRDESHELFDTAWTLSALRGIVSALVMIVVARFVTDARIASVLLALALSPLMIGLSNPRFVMFERDLVYSRVAFLTLGGKLVSVAVTLVIAFVYRDYWSLVIGMLAGTLVTMILSYVLRPYRPRFSLARFSDIFAFSGWLTLTSVVTTLSMETDKIIVGRLLGVAETGLYFMTQRVGVLPTRELVSPMQRILFPSFSELTGDLKRLRRGVCESINILGSLSLPAAFGFALVANDFVPLALGDQWIVIVPLLVILVPYLGLRATLSMTLPCVMALGRTRLLFWVSLVYALVHVPLFIVGTALYGLNGAIWSIVLAGVFYTYLNVWLLQRTLDISLGEILLQLRRPVCAVALMVGALVTIGTIFPLELFSENGSWFSLITKILVGGLVFCGALFVFWRMEGCPDGIERRARQVLSRRSAV
jgi:PST family polysaccharide transporter